MTPLIYYRSCFTDNYQDVCSAQKTEDVRFMEELVQLVRRHNVVRRMFEVYVEHLLRHVSSESKRKIQQAPIKKGANIASSSQTNQRLSSAIFATLSFSFVVKISIDTRLASIAAVSLTLVNYYGYVQEAAEAAHRLIQLSPFYYQRCLLKSLKCFIFSLST